MNVFIFTICKNTLKGFLYLTSKNLWMYLSKVEKTELERMPKELSRFHFISGLNLADHAQHNQEVRDTWSFNSIESKISFLKVGNILSLLHIITS